MTKPGRLLVLAALGLLLAAAPAGAKGPSDPFQGRWTSIDIVDDSSQQLTFGGAGETRRVTLLDDFATGCGPENESPAHARGVGTITGDTIDVAFHVHCTRTGERFDADFSFTYDGGTNTLTDTDGTIWAR